VNNLALHYASSQENSCDAMLERHAPLVARIAHHLKGRLPDTVEVDDLIQAGMIGLLEAVQNYQQGHGAGFETFAGIRIRGAMLDEVRRNDWTPRSVYRKSRELSRAIQEIEGRERRSAQPEEVAAELGVSLDEYHKVLQDVRSAHLLSVEDLGYEDDSALEHIASDDEGAGESLQRVELREEIARAIATLPEREALVLSLYYEEELNLREIGEVLSVSESRVCQLHSQAIARLRSRIAASA
jgi:RNA polymerase sigma factor for flagellar operon FliA